MKKVSFAIILVFAFHFSSYGQDAGRVSATWQVQKYDLDVTLPQDEKTRSVAVKGLLSLKNVSGKPASTLTLRISPAADVSAVKINDSIADFTKGEEKISTSQSLQRIVMRIASIAADGTINAAVEYKLNVKENSALASLSAISAQFLPLSFWYPTPNSWFFTQGADTAPFRIKVNSANGQTIASSGSENAGALDQKLNGQPFFVARSWDVSDQNEVAVYMPKGINNDGRKRASELSSLMSEARSFVTGVLGKPPNVSLKIISSRRAAGFSSGGSVIVDDAFFRRSKIDSLTAMNIAEAVAKLWIGNSTSVTGEGYGVVSEGLPRYIATQFIESKYGKDIADIERLRQRVSYAAISKRDAPLSKALPLDDYYYPEVANKGAMIWRLLARRLGANDFFNVIRSNSQDANLNLAELRAAFSSQKEMLDHLFDQVTDMDLMVGLPQPSGAETKVALRNTGAIDATIDVTATTDSGQKITAPTTIRAMSFGELGFKTNNKIVEVEVDSEKLYPQTDYSDDIAPNESTDSDPLLAVKRWFDKQDFVNTESTARKLLRDLPRYDDLRIFLARSLLAQNKNADAEKEFRAVLDEKLPSARSLAWANVGLGEVASRLNQKDVALKYAETAIVIDADYGAGLAARTLRNKLGFSSAGDAAVKTFFAEFDKAAAAKRKADLDAMTVPGEVTKLISGAAGSAEQWQTQIAQIDLLDQNTIVVEARMNVKLLGSSESSGTAVFRLVKVGSAWKLLSVDMFEVR